MSRATSTFTTFLSALVIACAMAAFAAQPAVAQSQAKDLKCNGCVNSKDIANNAITGNDIKKNAIQSSDIKDGQVKKNDLANNAVTGGKIKDGSVGPKDLNFDPATQAELDDTDTLGDLTCNEGQVAKIDSGSWTCEDVVEASDISVELDNLARLQASGASAYVFLTSETYTGNLGGVPGADDKCQILADQAGLPGIYFAWIASSDSAMAPAVRFTRAPSSYVLPPETAAGPLRVVADDWTALTDGTLLQNAINIDELGTEIPGDVNVWTNVVVNGVVETAAAGNGNCDDWSSDVSPTSGNFGAGESRDSTWTDAVANDCDFTNHLYCFGQ